MSWESALHVRLVETMAAEIGRRHGHLYSLTVFVDLPSVGRNRPSLISGYVPDVFALDVPETCRIIGEAKTPLDCETERSRLQMIAFLSHLSRFANSSFYLSVPLTYCARAECLLAAAIQAAGASEVTAMVMGGA